MATYTHSVNDEGVAVGRDMMFANGAGFASEPKTAEEAIAAAGLDWTVAARRAGYVDADGIFHESKIGKRAIVRTDTGADLGYVGVRYEPIQNSDMFSFANHLVDDFGAKFESAWHMYGGQRVGLAMVFPEMINIGGNDPYNSYLLMTGRHDGTGSVIAAVTDVRLRCTNMLNIALRNASNVFKIKHTANAASRVAAAREALEVTFKYNGVFEAEMQALIQQSLTDEAFKAITTKLLTAQNYGSTEKKVEAMLDLRHNSPTLQDEYRQTSYGALQALTEWTDWGQSYKTPQHRTHDLLDGRVLKLKTAAAKAYSTV